MADARQVARPPDAQRKGQALLVSGAEAEILGCAQAVGDEPGLVSANCPFLPWVPIGLDQPSVRLLCPMLLVVSPRGRFRVERSRTKR